MRSKPAEFLDTNILVYAFTTDVRAGAAQGLLGRGCITSVQALGEFANVGRRKLGMTWREVYDALAAIRTFCRVILPMDLETHADGLGIAERYRYAIFDALTIPPRCAPDALCRIPRTCRTVWLSTGGYASSIRSASGEHPSLAPTRRTRCRLAGAVF